MTKVVLVEDEAWLADMEADTLQKAGYDVRVATNALAAVDLVDDFMPDVIILDVLLSGPTGFSLLNELQSHSDTASIPVVLCTNLAENLTNTQLKNYGVKRVVDKTTMHPEDLVVAVKSVIELGAINEDESN